MSAASADVFETDWQAGCDVVEYMMLTWDAANSWLQMLQLLRTQRRVAPPREYCR